MTKYFKHAKLSRKLLCSVLLGSTLLLPYTAQAAVTIDNSYEYTEADAGKTITDNINISKGYIAYNYNADTDAAPLVLSGETIIIKQDTESTIHTYALSTYYSGSQAGNTLSVNPDGHSTVQITGNVQAKGKSQILLNLNNDSSYLAGDLIIADEAANIDLKLSNGATWYANALGKTEGLIQTKTYDLSTGEDKRLHITAAGGVIDLFNESPNKPRNIDETTRTVTFQNAGTSFDNSTFVIVSDINNGKADKVILTGAATPDSPMYVQIGRDKGLYEKFEAGKFDVKDGGKIDVISSNGDIVLTGKESIWEKADNGGLQNKMLGATPIFDVSDSLTGIDLVDKGTGDGPAQLMAQMAGTSAHSVLSAWRGENNDLMRRMGDLRSDNGTAGIWARYYGGKNEVKTSTASEFNYNGIQVGFDRKIELKGGKLYAGLAVSNMRGNIASSAGSGDVSSTLFGVYGSYYGDKGHFADVIVKYGRIGNKIGNTANSVHYEGSGSANGLNMSLEYGYHKELANKWYIEPQVELNYGHINANDYTMSAGGAAGAKVQNEAVNSFIGRLGMNVGKTTKGGNIYAKLSVAKEFAGDVGVRTSFGDYSKYTKESLSDTWFEYGVGFNQKLGKQANLYGEVSSTAGANKLSEKWKFNIGMRYTF